MAKDTNILKLVRAAFTKEKHKAPKSLWEGISKELDALDGSIDHEVNSAFQQERIQAPDLWGAIEKQMVIDDTWKNIKNSEVRRRNRRLALWLFPLVLTLGLSMWLLWPNKQNDLHVDSQPSVPETEQLEDVIVIDNTHSSKETDPKIVYDQAASPKQGTITEQGSLISSDRSADQHLGEVSTSSQTVTNGEDSKTIRHILDLNAMNARVFAGFTLSNVSASSPLIQMWPRPMVIPPYVAPASKWKVGVMMTVNNPVVKNNIQRQGERIGSTIQTDLTINLSMGVQAQYALGNGNYIQGQFHINKVQRQNFNLFEEGKFITKSNLFLYDQLSISYQRSLIRRNNQTVTAQIGGYGARLKIARELYEGQLKDIEANYKTVDLGLNLGVAYQRNWGKIGWTAGIFTDLGLVNVFKGDGLRPAAFDQTRHRNYYLSTGLYYSL